MVVLKSKHNERQEMNELTASELKIVTLAMTRTLLERKEEVSTKHFSDEYTVEVVKNLRELQRVYEKVIEIERQAIKAEQSK